MHRTTSSTAGIGGAERDRTVDLLTARPTGTVVIGREPSRTARVRPGRTCRGPLDSHRSNRLATIAALTLDLHRARSAPQLPKRVRSGTVIQRAGRIRPWKGLTPPGL